jgi:hypothetical protein
MILDPKFMGQRDYDIALRAALRANALTSGSDAGIQAGLAAVYFAKGDKPNAILHQQKAVSLASAGDRDAFKKDLDRYRFAG